MKQGKKLVVGEVHVHKKVGGGDSQVARYNCLPTFIHIGCVDSRSQRHRPDAAQEVGTGSTNPEDLLKGILKSMGDTCLGVPASKP